MYKLTITNIANQATNYLVHGELAKQLLSLKVRIPNIHEIFTLEGPVTEFEGTKIVVNDWQEFFQHIVAKQQFQKGYHTFQKIILDFEKVGAL